MFPEDLPELAHLPVDGRPVHARTAPALESAVQLPHEPEPERSTTICLPTGSVAGFRNGARAGVIVLLTARAYASQAFRALPPPSGLAIGSER